MPGVRHTREVKNASDEERQEIIMSMTVFPLNIAENIGGVFKFLCTLRQGHISLILSNFKFN